MVTNKKGVSVSNTATMPVYVLHSSTWTIACKKCVVKRKATVAQSATINMPGSAH